MNANKKGARRVAFPNSPIWVPPFPEADALLRLTSDVPIHCGIDEGQGKNNVSYTSSIIRVSSNFNRQKSRIPWTSHLKKEKVPNMSNAIPEM